jgi:hypothetical protein
MISFLTQALRNWRDRDLIAAERRRNAIVRQMNERKAAHREFKPLLSDLRKATAESLRASIGRSA